MIKGNKRLGGIILAAVLCAGLSGCDMVSSIKEYFSKKEPKKAEQQAPAQQVKTPAEKPLAANVLARVGQWTITTDEFNNRLDALKEVAPDYDVQNPEVKKQVLDELVRQQLLVEDAERTGIAKGEDILAAVEEFRRTLIVRETARKLTENITVSDEEAKAFYEEKKDLIVDAAEWHVRQIVVDTKLKASELYTEILKGADFSELAQMNSTADNAAQGGDMGFIADVPFAEMAPVLLDLGVGETSDVFEGPDGYYLIKLEEKKGGNQIPFEDVKEDIVKTIMVEKQRQAIVEYITKLEQEIPVEVNEDNLK